MKHTLPLQKKRAVELLGGSSAKAAAVLQYKSRAAVDKWPDTLSHRDSLMVLGALWLREQTQRPAHTINITISFGPWLAQQIMRGGGA